MPRVVVVARRGARYVMLPIGVLLLPIVWIESILGFLVTVAAVIPLFSVQNSPPIYLVTDHAPVIPSRWAVKVSCPGPRAEGPQHDESGPGCSSHKFETICTYRLISVMYPSFLHMLWGS